MNIVFERMDDVQDEINRADVVLLTSNQIRIFPNDEFTLEHKLRIPARCMRLLLWDA